MIRLPDAPVCILTSYPDLFGKLDDDFDVIMLSLQSLFESLRLFTPCEHARLPFVVSAHQGASRPGPKPPRQPHPSQGRLYRFHPALRCCSPGGGRACCETLRPRHRFSSTRENNPPYSTFRITFLFFTFNCRRTHILSLIPATHR